MFFLPNGKNIILYYMAGMHRKLSPPFSAMGFWTCLLVLVSSRTQSGRQNRQDRNVQIFKLTLSVDLGNVFIDSSFVIVVLSLGEYNIHVLAS
jgi:hypothetical protein